MMPAYVDGLCLSRSVRFGGFALLRLVILCLSLVCVLPGRAESRYYVPEVPADLSWVDFYLLTAGLGSQLHERFGHTGIRVHDRLHDRDVVFNWGKFSFHEPLFALKFYRGSLTYSMGVRTLTNEVAIFMATGRRLVQERINLTLAQKRALLTQIAWNARPENRDFAYQYWFKNCATIPRDYIDQVLAGQLRAATAAVRAKAVFRDYVRNNLQAIPFVAPGLDVVMNANIDRPISLWEEMFLPEKLRETLLTMPQVDDAGRLVPGTRLLTDTTVLVEAYDDLSPALPDYMLMALFGLVPLTVAALAWRCKRRLWAYRALGALGMSWGALSGFLGAALLINWLASGHPDTWHNANLLLFFPVDWLYARWGLAVWRARGPIKDRMIFRHSGRLLCILHLAAFLVLLAGLASGVLEQNLGRILTWFAVPAALLPLSYLTWVFEPIRPALASTNTEPALAAVPITVVTARSPTPDG